MNRFKMPIVLPLAWLVLVAAAPGASADSSDAMCEFRKDGETRHNKSGPCTVSQRQGYVDIDLRNGDTFSLRPLDKPGLYKDQKGNKVVRSSLGGGTQEFKWDGKRILVSYPNHGAKHASNDFAQGQGQGNSRSFVAAPSRAVQACHAQRKHDGQVIGTSALKPGWWEVTLSYKDGRYACVVNENGKIDEFNKLG